MKKLAPFSCMLLVAALSLIMLSCGEASKKVNSLFELGVKREVAQLQEQLPLDFGPLVMTAVEYDSDNATMMYSYVWKDEFNGVEFDREQVMAAKNNTIIAVKQDITTNPDTRTSLENGVSFQYEYNDPAGDLLYTFTVTSADL